MNYISIISLVLAVTGIILSVIALIKSRKGKSMPCQHTNIDCPCPKDCPRHGHCCLCVAHHKAAGTKLPVCLRGIEWQK